MPTLQHWMSQSPTSLDVVTPIKARACDALQAVLRSRPRQTGSHARIMTKGVERC
ncbi:hypothetical protein [Mycobacterium sp. 1245805.9]|uniref:hypothetical protein n=1 Tax=Mycobacterium sp. 1245805.9 TaxID=1856862 RepID=UPI0018D429D1|nr:hypothetical protein [Mycobacterium sp. 1245805.9]